jgi:hypothetical protein
MSEAEVVNGMAANNMVTASNLVLTAKIMKGKGRPRRRAKAMPHLKLVPEPPPDKDLDIIHNYGLSLVIIL